MGVGQVKSLRVYNVPVCPTVGHQPRAMSV